mgnify:CR=1 FL=1
MDSYPSRNIVWPRRAVVTAGMPYGNKPLHFGHVGGVFVPADCFAIASVARTYASFREPTTMVRRLKRAIARKWKRERFPARSRNT